MRFAFASLKHQLFVWMLLGGIVFGAQGLVFGQSLSGDSTPPQVTSSFVLNGVSSGPGPFGGPLFEGTLIDGSYTVGCNGCDCGMTSMEFCVSLDLMTAPAGMTVTTTNPICGTDCAVIEFEWQTGFCDAGDYSLDISYTVDGGAPVPVQLNFTVLNNNRQPDLDLTLSSQSVTEGDVVTVDMLYTDPDVTECGEDSLTPSVQNDPGGMLTVLGPNSASWEWDTTGSNPGLYLITFLVDDTHGNLFDTVAVQVVPNPCNAGPAANEADKQLKVYWTTNKDASRQSPEGGGWNEANDDGELSLTMEEGDTVWFSMLNLGIPSNTKYFSMIIPDVAGLRYVNLKGFNVGARNSRTRTSQAFVNSEGSFILKTRFFPQPKWERFRFKATEDLNGQAFTIKAASNCSETKGGEPGTYPRLKVENATFGGASDSIPGDALITELWLFPNQGEADLSLPAILDADPSTGPWTAQMTCNDPLGGSYSSEGVHWTSGGPGLTIEDYFGYEMGMFDSVDSDYELYAFDSLNGDYWNFTIEVSEPNVEECELGATAFGGSMGQPSSISNFIFVGDTGTIGDAQLRIDITHDQLDELVVELISPAGSVLRLHNQGASLSGDMRLTYNDQGVPNGTIAYNLDCHMQVALGGMSDFIGQDFDGIWELRITDMQPGANDGVLNGWCLRLFEDMPAPPVDCSTSVNDEFADVLEVWNGLNDVDNLFTTLDGPEAIAGMGSDSWYRYTATGTGDLELNMCLLPSFDSILAVYSMPNGGTPTLADLIIASDDDCGEAPSVSFSVTQGTEYLIQLGGAAGEQGEGTLEVLLSLPPQQFKRGDCNGDGNTDIADAINGLSFLFPGGGTPPALECVDACDANDDSQINIADIIASLGSLFGSPVVPLPAPSPNCGFDNTGAGNCAVYNHCP